MRAGKESLKGTQIMKAKIVHVVGARPNYMKVGPLFKTIEKHNRSFPNQGIEQYIVHTGQHYGPEMSELFFSELDMPKPFMNLGVGSGSHAFQTANTMLSFEKVLEELKPELVVVVGDVNSTLACAITAKKIGIKIAHIEAGLRSFDRSMPEEINRVLVDSISDLLFTTEYTANENLKNEGIDTEKIFFVGNIMVDSLVSHINRAHKLKTLEKIGISKNGHSPPHYGLLTMHRPSNVNNAKILTGLLETVSLLSKEIPIIFPAHPRVAKQISRMNLDQNFRNKDGQITDKMGFSMTKPLSYLDMLNLMQSALFVITDSGGIQEETTFLGIPCLTIRENTERPVTIQSGTNILVGQDPRRLGNEVKKIISGKKKSGFVPPLWDGKTSFRILEVVLQHFDTSNN